MLRLFISVNCDDKVKDQFLSVQEMIKKQSVKGNFSRPENLHTFHGGRLVVLA